MRLESQSTRRSDDEETMSSGSRRRQSDAGTCECGFRCSNYISGGEDMTTENDDSGFVGDTEGDLLRRSYGIGSSPRKQDFDGQSSGSGFCRKLQDTRRLCNAGRSRMVERNQGRNGFNGRGRHINPSAPGHSAWTAFTDLVANTGEAVLEFLFHLGLLIKKAPRYQLPLICVLLLLSLIGFYAVVVQMEYTFACVASLLVEWVWPMIRGSMRGFSYGLRFGASWVQRIEELGESVVCDLAQMWCDQFKLMCNRRCGGFTARAFERLSCM